MLSRLKERFDNEPVVVLGAVRAIIYAATLFGLNLTNDQFMALIVVLESVSAIFTRGKVTPTASTPSSINAGRFVPAVLLAVALAGAAGCGANVAPQLVAAEDAVHDALASAQDRIDEACAPGLMPTACQQVNAALVPALRAGAAFNRTTRDQQLSAAGTLIEAVGALITRVQALDAGAVRDAIVADLRRAIEAAFSQKGQ